MNRILMCGLAALSLAACAAPPGKPAAPPPASGVELAHLDRSVRPQDDFYRFVNGTWLKTTPIPADKAVYSVFNKLRDDSEARLRAIIEEAAAQPAAEPGSEAQKIGDFYRSFMDEARLEQLGLAPLAAELARIDALNSRKKIPALLAHYARIGVTNPIYSYVEQDAREATQYIVYLSQARPYWGGGSGLGLPDREYYLSTEPKFEQIRAQYVAHVGKTLGLAGVRNAGRAARNILRLETGIARLHWTRVEDRDTEKTYNKFDLVKLAELAPGIDWETYARELGAAQSPGFIVRQPGYLAGLDRLLRKTSLSLLKDYFRWHLLRSYSGYLNQAFVDADFVFYGKALRGIQEDRPRWKRAVEAVNTAMGEALGKVYVQRHFSAADKARMQQLVANLLGAYQASIRELDWMSDGTKQKALEKLAKFTVKIGYPDRWRDYSALAVSPGDLVGNMMRSSEFETGRQLAKLGKPIDRAEWNIPPQTVNAFYNAGLNEIVFPAAILQPPFFYSDADDAINYGAIGAGIGHEIGHGFDDQGSKYDGDGNLRTWWTAEDRARFEARTRALIAQYGAYEPIPGYKVNGAQTVGENIGDLGGASIAYRAYRTALGGKAAPVLDGFTGDQRFFIGFAQIWVGLYREPALIEWLKTRAWAPAEYRCNGPLVNIPEFYAAFGVKEGDRMYKPPAERVKIW